jgi:hypothetical protein
MAEDIAIAGCMFWAASLASWVAGVLPMLLDIWIILIHPSGLTLNLDDIKFSMDMM